MSSAVGRISIEELEPRPMGMRDVRVRLEASGLCHTDSSVLSGDIPSEKPIVLGHEGVGVVEAVGPATSRVAVGQRVRQGDVIAASGNVGRSLLPHLHFHVTGPDGTTLPISFREVRPDGVPRMLRRYRSTNAPEGGRD